jgi:uncharacterized protein YndB with AHSA1/START domain
MAGRTDRVSRLIPATTANVYRALTDATAVAAWLPPANMKGEIRAFEPRPGGAFHMVLTYVDPGAGTRGKSGDDFDAVRGRFVRLRPDAEVIQSFSFASDDPAFAGTMTMTWSLRPEGDGTEVTITCTDVPAGIKAEDHEAGMNSSLDNLAAFLADPP